VSGPVSQANRRTVIVIDDDAMMRKALESVLDANGFEPLLFESGEAAISSDALETATCIVTDIVLPGMSGFELCELLTRRGHRLPIVFITAHDEAAVHAAAARARAEALFIKPFSGRALVRTIQKIRDETDAAVGPLPANGDVE